jgi:Holliday junction DNA helicase RuvA
VFAGFEKDVALIEVGGITYGVLVCEAVAEQIRRTASAGVEVSLFTYSYIEGNPGLGNLMPRLVGFIDRSDLDFFLLLTSVQGLGVKKALRSLVVPIREVARAIEMENITLLTKLPEIGRKTAQKIVMELKGKAGRFAMLDEHEKAAAGRTIENEFERDAVDILVQLQYAEAEAEHLVSQTVRLHPELQTAEELIQVIFKQQGGRR